MKLLLALLFLLAGCSSRPADQGSQALEESLGKGPAGFEAAIDKALAADPEDALALNWRGRMRVKPSASRNDPTASASRLPSHSAGAVQKTNSPGCNCGVMPARSAPRSVSPAMHALPHHNNVRTTTKDTKGTKKGGSTR